MGYFDFYASLLLAIVFARLFFRIGQSEYGNGYVTGLLSVTLSLIGIWVIASGVKALFVLHVLLFLTLWVFNYMHERFRGTEKG